MFDFGRRNPDSGHSRYPGGVRANPLGQKFQPFGWDSKNGKSIARSIVMPRWQCPEKAPGDDDRIMKGKSLERSTPTMRNSNREENWSDRLKKFLEVKG